MTLKKASEVFVGDFVSVYGAWWEVAAIRPTWQEKLEFTFEHGRTIEFNPDDTVLIRDM